MLFKTNIRTDHGHPDLVFECDTSTVPDVDARWLLNLIAQEITRGVIFRDGQTMQLGWIVLKLSLQQDGFLHLQEPDFSSPVLTYINSVTRTLKQFRAQRDTVASCAEDVSPLFPSMHDTVAVCAKLEQANTVLMTREGTRETFSGWMISDANSLSAQQQLSDNYDIVSLYDLSRSRPDLIKFFAFPPGYGAWVAAYDDIAILKAGMPVRLRPDSFLVSVNVARNEARSRIA